MSTRLVPHALLLRLRLLALLAPIAMGGALGASGCAPGIMIPGTRVPDTKINRELIELCEKYRRALEDRDAETVLSLAAPSYFEDSGTPSAEDDYGFEGLQQVVNTRLAALKSLRYDIQYRGAKVEGRRASIDIRYDASYQIGTDMGDRWERKQNEKRLELEHDGSKWRFVSGM